MSLSHQDSTDPIVIVGMGGGGLAAAIKLIQAGKKVVIFENRDYFTRPQRIFLDAASQEFIESLIDPNDEYDKLFSEKYREERKKSASQAEGKSPKISVDDDSIRVRSLQKFLHRKLLALQKKHPDLVEINHGSQIKISAIDPEKQELTYSENGEVKKRAFSHFIEADGARHAMADLLNKHAKENGKDPFFNFSLQEVQHRHPPCGVIQCKLNIPKTIGDDEKVIAKSAVAKLLSGIIWNVNDGYYLKRAGWNAPYYPRLFIYGNTDEMKLGIASEIPEDILKLAADPAKQVEYEAQFLEWARFLFMARIRMFMNDPEMDEKEKEVLGKLKPDDFIILPKEFKDEKIAKFGSEQEYRDYINQIKKMNLTAFTLDYWGADKASTVLPNGGTYALVGDSYQCPWFFGSHGMNDSIGGGLAIADVFTGKLTLEEYNAHLLEKRENETNMISAEISNGNTKSIRFDTEFKVFRENAEKIFEYLSKHLLISQRDQVRIQGLLIKTKYESEKPKTIDQLLTLKKNVHQLNNELAHYKGKIVLDKPKSAAYSAIKRKKTIERLHRMEVYVNSKFDTDLHLLLRNNFPQRQVIRDRKKLSN